MDVVYVIGTGSKWDNNELKYSLRSISKYAQHLGDVYIVGDELPSFIHPEKVHYLKVADSKSLSPYQNVAVKIARAFGKWNYLDRFLLSSDDHFFIAPVDFDTWPVHYKADRLPDERNMNDEGIGDRQYRRVMLDTRRFMEQLELDTKFYEGHTNKLYTREAWLYLCSRWVELFFVEAQYGICLNSPMAATIMKLHPEYPCVKRKDIKLRHLNTPEDWIAIENAKSFSIYDSAIKTGVAEYLQKLFPEKCRFEK